PHPPPLHDALPISTLGTMSGVLRPVGPEPARTYWVRRAVVLGFVAVALVVLVATIRSLLPPEPTQAVPPPQTSGPAHPDQPASSPTSGGTPSAGGKGGSPTPSS